MEDKEAKTIIEAMLFMSGEAVSLDTLRKIIEVDKYNTERLVKELINDYALRNTGLMILEVAEGYQMVTNPACAPWIKKLLSTSVPKKLSQSSLETMAIIAYKQPIIKSEIEAIRGVNSDGVVKTLLEKRLVKILGRKEVPGRPLMYGTTQEFLQYFGLKDLTELPTLKEFAEVDVPEPPEAPADGMESLEAMKGEGRAVDEHLEEEETAARSETADEAAEPVDSGTDLDNTQERAEEEHISAETEETVQDLHDQEEKEVQEEETVIEGSLDDAPEADYDKEAVLQEEDIPVSLEQGSELLEPASNDDPHRGQD